VGLCSAGEKMRVGLQQLMAGVRKWRVDLISRDDLAALTEDAAKITGIPYIMDAYREEALEIIDAQASRCNSIRNTKTGEVLVSSHRFTFSVDNTLQSEWLDSL
jgi:hypothetical protein